MKKIILILCLGLLFVQCNSDDGIDCSLVLCEGPSFIFEFFDADTGENLLDGVFDNGAPDGFFITLGEDDSILEFEQDYGINSVNELSVFRFSEQFQISFSDAFDVTIAYDFDTTPNGCCPNYLYENVTVTNATFEQEIDGTSLILRIFI